MIRAKALLPSFPGSERETLAACMTCGRAGNQTEVNDGFGTALAAGCLAAAVTTGGILTIRRFKAWTRENATYFACFAAGVLIAVSFLHILPKCVAMRVQAPAYLCAGYPLVHLLNRFLTAYVCDKPETADYALGLVPLIGIAFHSFLDSVVYSISFSVSLFTGALVAFGMVLHELPEGIVTHALLLRSGFTERRSLVLAFLAAGITAPLGTLVSYPFISKVAEPLLGSRLALSAGALIYVGATHLLSHAEAKPRRFSLVALFAGVPVAEGIVLSKG
jgi:zinc and cadmium transporter